MDHLRICIEMYLNEIYIYKCRLKNLLNVVQNANGPKVERFWTVFRVIDRNLSDLLRSRNWNVHNRRFEDPDLALLTLLDLLALKMQWSNAVFRMKYLEVRKKWVKMSKANADSMATYFGAVCCVIEPFLETIFQSDEN